MLVKQRKTRGNNHKEENVLGCTDSDHHGEPCARHGHEVALRVLLIPAMFIIPQPPGPRAHIPQL